MTTQDSLGHQPEGTDVTRRDALRQGLVSVAAGGLAFSAPKVQGLAARPKHGEGLSKIKKRRRCRTGQVRFRCRPRRRGGWSGWKGHRRNGDPEGTCLYKGGSKGNIEDFMRRDIEVNTGTGTIESDSFPFSFVVAENTGNECPVIFQFHDQRLRFSKYNFAAANNCRVPGDIFDQHIGSSGSATAPMMWQTPSWATGSKTMSVSASFEEVSADDLSQGYK